MSEVKIPTPDEVLENCKGKGYNNVLVIGFTNNNKVLTLDTNRATYEFVNYALNRANFQVNLLENNNNNAAVAAEQQIAEQVTIEAPRKKGRPRKVA